MYSPANLARVKRVIVAMRARVGVFVVWVFPGLWNRQIPIFMNKFMICSCYIERWVKSKAKHDGYTDLREGAVVPYVALVREAVFHKARFSVERVLDDGVQTFFARYLSGRSVVWMSRSS